MSDKKMEDIIFSANEYNLLSWLFGSVCLAFGLFIYIGAYEVGLSFIAISFVMLPPTRDFLYMHTKIKIGLEYRLMIIFTLVIFIVKNTLIGA